MKKTLLLAVVALFLGTQTSFAVVNMGNVPVSTFGTTDEVTALPADLAAMQVDQFMSLTPSKYREMTGEKLGWKKSLQLKAAQKAIKKNLRGGKGEDIPKGLYVVAVLFGWGFLVMGLMDDWSGKNWWMNLILTILCWLPGVIHGLVKMKDYYK